MNEISESIKRLNSQIQRAIPLMSFTFKIALSFRGLASLIL